jgi:uncharacterized repeat protein (TIGR02543 family)
MVRSLLKKNLAVILAFIMVFGLMPVLPDNLMPFERVAKAASVTSGDGAWIAGKLTYSYSVETSSDNTSGAGGSVSANGGTLTVKATSAKEYETGGCNSTTVQAASTTTTVTVTNASNNPIKFTTLSVDGDAIVAAASQGQTIASGATFTVTVVSPANGTNNTEKSGTVTVTVEEQSEVTITAVASPYVSYSLNGNNVEQNGSDVSFEVAVNSSIDLPSVTAPSGFQFIGWRVGNELKALSTASFVADADYSVFPVIIPSDIDIHAQNFKVGNTTYTFWEDAISAASSGSNKIVIVNQDVTLPNSLEGNLLPASGGTYVKPASAGGIEYILPAGITLLVPFNDANTLITDATLSSNYEEYNQNTPSVKYRELVVQSGSRIKVSGNVSVASKTYCMGTGQSGPYGQITLNDGSEMVFRSVSNLYAIGYIKGFGSVTVESGATVYECMFVGDYPGSASNMMTLAGDNSVFPFSKYTVRNVEVSMTLNYGASEKVFYSLYGTSAGYHSVWVNFIDGASNSSALFSCGSDGSLTKSYDKTMERQIIASNGTAAINNMVFRLNAGFTTVNVDTSSLHGLPIPYNYDLTVESGVLTVNENIILSKGSTTTVNAGARVIISSEKNLYVMDSSDDPQSVGSGLSDAKLDVNGTIEVSGGLWTSANNANITSSGKTGKIIFNSDVDSNITKTIKLKSGSTTAPEVIMSPAQLKNGITNPQYTPTAGASAGTTFFYCAAHNKWETGGFTVTFNANGGSGTMQPQTFCGEGGTLTPNTFIYDGYTFAGWNTAANGSGTPYADEASINPDGNLTLYAQWVELPSTYTVTWKVEGQEDIVTTVNAGETPVYPNGTPTKASDAQYTYTFAGWDPEIAEVTGNATYTAQFTPTPRTYTVTLDTLLGGTIAEGHNVTSYTCGTAVALPGAEYVTLTGYTFAGWYTDINYTGDPVTEISASDYGDKEFFAKWDANTYTVTFTVNGGYYSSSEFEYGKPVTAPVYTVPAGHTFSGWDCPEAMPAEDITLNATLTVNRYTILFVNWNGDVLQSTQFAYGAMPEYYGDAPVRLADEDHTYTFACWTPDITEVTGEATYTAVFHSWGAPTWAWAEDHMTATATFICDCGIDHFENATVTVATADATCTADGAKTYTAKATYNGREYTDTYTESIPATGHDWGAPTYAWTQEGTSWKCTAKRICANDASHVETEVGRVTSNITTPATCTGMGTTTYTATFTNEAFTTQTKDVEDVPMLGHDWEFVGFSWIETSDGYSAVANYVCKNDNGHTRTESAAVTSTTTSATCETAGQIVYTATHEENTGTKTVTIPATGHAWGAPAWSWTGYTGATATFTCANDSTHTQTVTATITSEITTAATCEGTGVKTYTATVTFNGQTYTDTKTETIPAIGHAWGAPSWSWTGYTGATATFICANDPSHVETVNAVITSAEGTGENVGHTVYTATVVFNGTTYTDEKAVINTYTITFVNYDGEVLQTVTVDYNQTPEYTGETPVRPDDDQYAYTFTGWDPQIVPATANATYTAQFEATLKGYHIYVTDYTRGRATTSIVAEQLYSGEVTFTVTCDIACAVAIDNGSDSYTRLTCTTENGEHKFTVTVNADVYIVVVVRGDVNFDGNVKAIDATRIGQAAAGNTTLTALQILAADLNYDGIIKAMDATKAKQVAVGNQTYNW